MKDAPYLGEYVSEVRRTQFDVIIRIPDELYRAFRRRSQNKILYVASYSLYRSPCLICWDDLFEEEYFGMPQNLKLITPHIRARKITIPNHHARQLELSDRCFLASDEYGQFFTIWPDKDLYNKREEYLLDASNQP